MTGAGSYTTVGTLDFTSPTTATAPAPPDGWVATSRSITIGGLNIPNSGDIFIRFTSAFASGSGEGDELALDDITVTAAAVPEPSTYALLTLGMLGVVLYLRYSARGREAAAA